MKAHDYLPSIYDSNLEMNVAVKSYEDELEQDIKPDIENEFKDGFALIATENGISRYEKIFGIRPNTDTEDLEMRRERIMNRLISKIPFTEKFLQQQLDIIIGKGQWNYEIDYNNYTLDINITTPGKTWLRELNDLLDRIIPANVVWTVNIYQASWQSVKDNFNTWQDVYDANLTWQELLDGDWL